MTGTAADSRRELRRADKAQWTGRTRGGYIGNLIFVTLLRRLGIAWAYAILVPVTFYYLFFAPKALRASMEYRARIKFDGPSILSKIWNSYRHFYSFGQILLDRIAVIGGKSSKFRFRFDGESHLRKALAGGKGLVLISAHCGNWELAAHLLGRLDARVNVVAYEGEVAKIRQYLSEVMRDRYFSVIEMDGTQDASLKIISALSRGEVVTMHADRVLKPNDQNSMPMHFLGKPTRFPTGPYYAAAVSGAPLIHAFTMRKRAYRYHLYAYPPEYLSFGKRSERRQQLSQWLGLFVKRLEDVLRKHPLQWHNFYSFWKEDTCPV